jgi:hypothetical protein
LAISPNVLDLSEVVVTDGNASSDYVRFAGAPAGLSIVDRDLTFSEYWTDEDPIQGYRKKSKKCAEVLVPDRLDARYVVRAYVVDDRVQQRLQANVGTLEVVINRHLFFC